MAVHHHLRPGLTDRTRVKIMTVDVPTRRVEAVIKDGSMIHIAVWDVPHAFRWPHEGEIWIVRRDNGFWVLDHRQQQAKDESEHPVTAMNPGEMKLDSPVIIDANGNRLAIVETLPSNPALNFRGVLMMNRIRSGSTHTQIHL